METDNEVKDLLKLEKEVEQCIEIVDQLIKVTNENINKLNIYINYKYNEIEKLIRKKRTRIELHTSEERNRMTLFYDSTYGNVPSNEDAIKLDDYLSTFPNIRKKYEYKQKVWSKNNLKQLFENVEDIARKYAYKYLISPNMSKPLREIKIKEIKEMDTNQLFNELKAFLETKKSAEPNMEEERSYNENSQYDTEEEIKTTLYKKENILSFSEFMQKFWKEVSQKLNKGYSVRDCQATWVHYGCFDKENIKWEEEEVNNLLKLCKKYNNKNWLAIARELNTNRSPACCFEKYIKISKLYKKKETTKTERLGYNALEDIQLQLLVSILGDNRWAEVTNCMHSLNPYTKRAGASKEKLSVLLNKLGKQEADCISYKRRYYRLINARQKNT